MTMRSMPFQLALVVCFAKFVATVSPVSGLGVRRVHGDNRGHRHRYDEMGAVCHGVGDVGVRSEK